MSKKLFFNPTALYKEFIILDSIEYNPHITQRDLAKLSKGSVSMVNQYLDTYEQKGYINKNYMSKKDLIYSITDKGRERKRFLNIGYLNEIHKRYKEAKKETITFIDMIITKGYKDIIFYGAGEVSEILLQTITEDNSIPINIVGVIDDDTNKQGRQIVNTIISNSDIIKTTKHDAIMIVSHSHYNTILTKLMEMDYPKESILHFL